MHTSLPRSGGSSDSVTENDNLPVDNVTSTNVALYHGNNQITTPMIIVVWLIIRNAINMPKI